LIDPRAHGEAAADIAGGGDHHGAMGESVGDSLLEIAVGFEEPSCAVMAFRFPEICP